MLWAKFRKPISQLHKNYCELHGNNENTALITNNNGSELSLNRTLIKLPTQRHTYFTELSLSGF